LLRGKKGDGTETPLEKGTRMAFRGKESNKQNYGRREIKSRGAKKIPWGPGKFVRPNLLIAGGG